MVVCGKMVMSEPGEGEEEEEIVGDVTLFKDSVKRRVNGKSEVLATLESEEERVKALREFIEVDLDDEEVRGIGGMVSELL